MPWENEIIESYQWKMSIQNPDIIKIARKHFRCRLASGRNPLALLPRLEHFSPQISSISLKSLKILQNHWKLLKNDHNLIDFKISLLCCHESNVFHHKFVTFWVKTSTFEQKLEISCTWIQIHQYSQISRGQNKMSIVNTWNRCKYLCLPPFVKITSQFKNQNVHPNQCVLNTWRNKSATIGGVTGRDNRWSQPLNRCFES